MSSNISAADFSYEMPERNEGAAYRKENFAAPYIAVERPVAGRFMVTVDKGEPARREMCLVLEQMGFEIEAVHHEVAAGQHEIGFKYAEALRGALAGGSPVIAVLGGGVDVVYPKENKALFQSVEQNGCLISEYPPGTEAKGKHFPVRNRILSGLSTAVLVVEAPEKSGALITADRAIEQSRDVYAVPGPIDATESAGCHRLIRQGAGLVTSGWDILQDYTARFPGKLRCEEGRPQLVEQLKEEPVEEARKLPRMLDLKTEGAELSDDQLLILRTLTDEPVVTDDLIELVQIPARRVLSALTMLEIDEYVLQLPGKRYVRNVLLSE